MFTDCGTTYSPASCGGRALVPPTGGLIETVPYGCGCLLVRLSDVCHRADRDVDRCDVNDDDIFFEWKGEHIDAASSALFHNRAFAAGLTTSVGAADRTVIDGAGRTIQIPAVVERVICSGPGSLRLLTYLQAEDKIVAVDDMEKQRPNFDARPYALAHQQFKKYPIFGEFRGYDHPELILSLDPLPQVILKTFPGMGHDPVELQNKTGIPVVIVRYGELAGDRDVLYDSLRLIGEIVDRRERAEMVISFFEAKIADLQGRTGGIPSEKRPTCFVGGIALKVLTASNPPSRAIRHLPLSARKT